MTTDILPQQCSQCAALAQEVIQLRAELQLAHRDPIWGIYTRVGLERRMPHPDSGMAAVVLDVDHMDDCNDKFGHGGFDSRMTDALLVCRDGDVIAGRWQQGDEVVIFTKAADAKRMAARLMRRFRARGYTATFAIVFGCDHAAVARAQTRIEAAKRAGERGRVFVVDHVALITQSRP